jgi:hypothetical protein
VGGRSVEWATQTLTEGEILGAFAKFCRDDLDEVEVIDRAPERLFLAWRRERATLEIRPADLRVPALPALLLAELDDQLVGHFLDDPALRERVAVYDLVRLEKVNAVRSSLFVHFEWFLRDAYRVKVLPAPAFTQGLVDRGIISLGMG